MTLIYLWSALHLFSYIGILLTYFISVFLLSLDNFWNVELIHYQLKNHVKLSFVYLVDQRLSNW